LVITLTTNILEKLLSEAFFVPETRKSTNYNNNEWNI